MSKSLDDVHAKIERGRDAAVIAALVRESIDEQMRIVMQQLINLWRAGEVDHDLIMGYIGQLAGYQNLLVNLETKQKIGASAMEKTVNG